MPKLDAVRYNVQEITFVNCNSATDKQRYIFLTFVATWLACSRIACSSRGQHFENADVM